eukprot:2273052-Rhodomonas_salina.1
MERDGERWKERARERKSERERGHFQAVSHICTKSRARTLSVEEDRVDVNIDLSGWDTSLVTTMNCMFYSASAFKGPAKLFVCRALTDLNCGSPAWSAAGVATPHRTKDKTVETKVATVTASPRIPLSEDIFEFARKARPALPMNKTASTAMYECLFD